MIVTLTINILTCFGSGSQDDFHPSILIELLEITMKRRSILNKFIQCILVVGAVTTPILSSAKGGRGGRTLRLYRSNGRFAGRIDPNGRHYDAQGRYIGRVEGQRIYDSRGRYIGRFEESGAFYGNGVEPFSNNSVISSPSIESGFVEELTPSLIQSQKPHSSSLELIRIIPESEADGFSGH